MRGSQGTQQVLTVALRVRPMNGNEINIGAHHISHVVDDKLVVLQDPNDDADDILRVNRSREKQYTFDCAFGPQSSQQDVYRLTTKSLIEGVLEGYNATVFAYGPTGAGKTYTMLGTGREPGIMVLTLNDLYSDMEAISDDVICKVSISYLEIYNEMIRDLLNPASGILELREDHRGVNVVGLQEVETTSVDEIMRLLSLGNSRRTCEPTAVNKTSSRSHAVMQVVVQARSRVVDVSQEVRTGRLFMVDLAGSERASQTQNRGKRMLEGAHINRSLLALGNCINALGGPSKVQYVNYRDSKLTRLLKDSLGGNCRTVMITHISPASTAYEESHNTLKYAERAKHIKTKTSVNVHDVSYHVLQYNNIIADLRREIERLKGQLGSQRAHPTTTCHAHSSQEGAGLLEELKQLLAEQDSAQRKLAEVQCSLTSHDLDIQKAKLRDEYLSACEDVDTDDNLGPSHTDLVGESTTALEGCGLLSPPSLPTPEGPKTADQDLGVLRGERRRLSLQQRTLTHKLSHINARSTDLSERLQDLLSSGPQKDSLDLMLKNKSLEMQLAEQSQLSASTSLHLADCECLVEHLLEQNRCSLAGIRAQRQFIRRHDIEYPAELELTYQKLLRQHRYLSNWQSWSTRLSSIPSEAHLTDGTDDGDDEASVGTSPSHRGVPRPPHGLARASPQNLTISSVASLPSIGKEGSSPCSPTASLTPRPLTDNSSKSVKSDQRLTGIPKWPAKSFLPNPSSPRLSEEEDHLPLLPFSTKPAKHKPKSRSTAGNLPCIVSPPPVISVSRCSTMSKARSRQRHRPTRPQGSTHSLAVQSDTSLGSEAWSSAPTGSKLHKKGKSKPFKPSTSTLSQIAKKKTRKLPLHSTGSSSSRQQTEGNPPTSGTPVPKVDAIVERRKKAAQKKRQLIINSSRPGADSVSEAAATKTGQKPPGVKRAPSVKVAFSPYTAKPLHPTGQEKTRPRPNLKILGMAFK